MNFKKPWHQQYKQERAQFAGRSFASGLEASLYGLLLLEEKAGEIQDVRCQPHVFLTEARIEMIPDYLVFDIGLGEDVYCEAKGFETPVWALKLKLWRYYGPGRLRIYKGTAARPKLVEEVVPKG